MKHPLNLKLFSVVIFCLVFSGCAKIEPERIVKVQTVKVSEESDTTWLAEGNILDPGEDGISDCGFCYATHSGPAINTVDSIIGLGPRLEAGGFTGRLNALDRGTKYYIRAYATNSAGTIYGKELSFTTKPVEVPTVITSNITGITDSSAMSGGRVASDGGSVVTARGVCWSTAPYPTIADNLTTDGSGMGSFTSSITGLSPNTTYYVSAYATNSAGTAYGDDYWFATQISADLPTITTILPSDITASTAQTGGNITSEGASPVTAKGVCWSTTPNPTLADNYTSDGSGTGSFTSSLSGLSPETTYYVRAYATNSDGTAYGDEYWLITESSAELATIYTTVVSNITESSAQSGGEITSDGGSAVTARGVCWSFTSNPTIADNLTTDGSGMGSFTSLLTGLSPNSTYYFRAYATNSAGTAYGIESSFSTPSSGGPPTVTTTSVNYITESTAQSGGEVTSDGGSLVTARGVCWSTSTNPTLADSYTSDGSGTGSFTSAITGLNVFTVYYVRTYATNTYGISYGAQVSFRTLWDNSTITDFDGNVYNTVQIGDQVWMAENMKVTRFADGTAIPLVEDSVTWGNLESTDKAYCWYDNNASYGNTYGALYTWAATMNGAEGSDANPSGIQGVCPTGWHVPSDSEWKQLEMSLGMSQADADGQDYYRGTDEGGKLKATGTAHWQSPNTGATNESGFTALPGGVQYGINGFGYIGQSAEFWTATVGPWARSLDYENSKVLRFLMWPTNGISVRCVKD